MKFKGFKPLPALPIIKMGDIPDMSVILQAGSNWATKSFENYINGFPYKPPFTHAFVYITNGDCANVVETTYIQKLKDIVKKSHVYVVIGFPKLSAEQIKNGKSISYRKAGSKKNKFKRYDVWGFISFGLRKLGLKKAKGTKDSDFCSDQVVDIFQEIGEQGFMGMDSEKTSPCNLFLKLNVYENARLYYLKM